MQINLKVLSHVLLFFFFFYISVMATKSSLCRQTVWASKPQTASWSELVTTNNYQIHHSDLEKAIKQSSVLLHSKVKKVRNKQLLFPLYPFTFNSLWHSTPAPKEQPPLFRSLMYFSRALALTWGWFCFDEMSDIIFDSEHQQLFGIRL